MSTYGLSKTQFVESLTEEQALLLVAKELREIVQRLSVDGSSPAVHKVVEATLELNEALADDQQRIQIASMLSDEKLRELFERLEIRTDEPRPNPDKLGNLDGWQLDQLKRFFSIVDELDGATPIAERFQVKPSYGLFDHQLVAVEKVMRILEGNDSRRGLLHFPTGGGKTRTAMHVVCQLLVRQKCVVVWFASGAELLEQAVETFSEAWQALGNRNLDLYRIQGDAEPDLGLIDDGIVVCGLQKGWAVRKRDETYWKKLADKTRLVVFDEAHQSIASTYKILVEDLCYLLPTSVLGLSATPGRTWADLSKDAELADFYERYLVSLEVEGNENPVDHLIRNGFLSNPEFETLHIDAGMDISAEDQSTNAETLEIPEHVIRGLEIKEQYLAAIVGRTHDLIKDGHTRILIFAASVKTTRLLAGLLASVGVKASAITGATPKGERDRAIKQFKRNEPDPIVLVNFGVLTTGFDAPQATAAVIARPTKSLILFSQMVGRVIRGPEAGGTSTCKVVSVVDTSLPAFGSIAEAFENWNDVWG